MPYVFPYESKVSNVAAPYEFRPHRVPLRVRSGSFHRERTLVVATDNRTRRWLEEHPDELEEDAAAKYEDEENCRMRVSLLNQHKCHLS